MEPQLEELPDNRVRLTVDVPKAQLEHAVEHAASDLAESVKIPGFRQGKVPMPVLLARVGRERLHSEAVESHIGGWFMNAAARSRIRPVEQPQYDYELPQTPDEDWRFIATVSVQPKPEPADWTQLEVPAPEAEVPEEIVEHELNVLRSSVAELTPVEGRPAQPGDTVVVDLVVEGQEPQRDYVVELGAGRLVPELERALVGMSPGETPGGSLRALRGRGGDGRAHRQGAQGEGAAAARRRAGARRERVRHARRASLGHRVPPPRANRRGDRGAVAPPPSTSSSRRPASRPAARSSTRGRARS